MCKILNRNQEPNVIRQSTSKILEINYVAHLLFINENRL